MPIRNVKIGNNTRVHEPINLYECSIGNDCIIGAFTEIGRGVLILNNCKIQAHCFIPEGVIIGHHVFIGPGTVFTNDKYPSVDHEWQPATTLVKSHVNIGAHCTILPGIVIGQGALIGAGSVVTHSIPPLTVAYGVPARAVRPTREEDYKRETWQLLTEEYSINP